MKYSAFRLGALTAALILAHGSAHATNGLFMPGFGYRAIGMGGVGIAYGRDPLSQGANPANIVNTGMRGDMGVAIFNAERNACSGTATGLLPLNEDGESSQSTLGFDGCSESDNKYFIMPEMGMSMPLTEQVHVGMAFLPYGGGGTSYPFNFFSMDGTVPDTPTSDAKLGVDMMILQAPVTVAYKVNEDHAVGASLAFAVNRFRAYGLQAFKEFDTAVAPLTSDPDHLTNKGYDYSYGAGIHLGYLGEFMDDKLTLGLVYNSRTYMTKFDKYRGLFAEQGDFDLPENYGIGFAYKPMKNLVFALDVLQYKFSDVASIGNRGPHTRTEGGNQLTGIPSNFNADGTVGSTVIGTPKELGNNQGMGFGFSDQTVYKLGVQYGVNQRLQVRAGINYGETPIAEDQVTFATLAPAGTERHYSVGFTYMASEQLEITGAYMYVPSNPQESPDRQNVVGAATINMHQNIFGVTLGWVLDPGLSATEYGDDPMEAFDWSGIYLGFGIGKSNVNFWSPYANNFVNSSFGTSTPVSSNDKDLGFKVFGGYQLNKYFGVEAGFVDFNDVRASSTVAGGSVYTTMENDSWTLAGVGTLPLGHGFSVFGKLGINSWSSNLRTVSTDAFGDTVSATEGSNDYDVFYGVGASYALLESIELRAEYERYKFDDRVNVDLMSAGVAFRF